MDRLQTEWIDGGRWKGGWLDGLQMKWIDDE